MWSAAVRSAVAPGWGQAYNGQGVKAVLFGIGGYGGVASAAGLAVGGLVAGRAYDDVQPGPSLTPAEAGAEAQRLYALRNGLYTGALVVAGAAAAVWAGGVVDALLSAPREGT